MFNPGEYVLLFWTLYILIMSAMKHGEPKRKPVTHYNFFESFFGWFVFYVIFVWAGLFRGAF